jgi:hypothetical protein
MSHRCPMCDNPYPYQCINCSFHGEDVGPAASRAHAPQLSMGKMFSHCGTGLVEKLMAMKAGLIKPDVTDVVDKKEVYQREEAVCFPAARKNVASGEDVCF